ncbi:MAG: kynureninase [Cytophagales bacterium]|nr:kynureninase [Cytophaga sp.]
MTERFIVTRAFAAQLDKEDPLAEYRKEFLFPKQEVPVIYFSGHSLGLQPKQTKTYALQELDDWERWAVEGHWKAKNPWLTYHQSFAKPLSILTGSFPDEVVAMNSLTTNLHFMLASFYRPAGKKIKIITEGWNFPSDRFALESLVKLYGYDPKKVIIELKPAKGKFHLTIDEVCKAIDKHKTTVALVLFNGVNYYTGQAFDMQRITQAAHVAGAFAGFDLAHAIGNIQLQLHDWNVDFAVWCSYKYLNAGPGAVGGAFVHQKHGHDKTTPRMAGWWGHEQNTRFQLEGSYKPLSGAAGFQVSNAPVMNMVGLKASLEIFMNAGWNAVSKKRNTLFDYMVFLIKALCTQDQKKRFSIEIITPLSVKEHGCMLSIRVEAKKGKELFNLLSSKGYWVDWRDPDVIRIAPVPLYNRYQDIYNLVMELSRHTALVQ